MATKIKKRTSVKKSRTNTDKKNVLNKKSSRKRAVKSSIKNFRPDTKQTASLIKIGRTSAAKAIRESKALGLSITYMKNGVLYKESADGQIEVLEQVSKKTKTKDSFEFKKGMIFHAKK